MIPLPALSALGSVPWAKIIRVLVIAAAGAAIGAAAMRAVKNVELNALVADHAKAAGAWATEKQQAADAYATALLEVVARTKKLQDQIDAQEVENAKVIAAQAARNASLAAANRGLQHRLAALTAPATPAGEPTCPAAVDLQERVTELGGMVTRIDELAERAVKAADDYADELRACRAYVTTVRPVAEEAQ